MKKKAEKRPRYVRQLEGIMSGYAPDSGRVITFTERACDGEPRYSLWRDVTVTIRVPQR